MDKPPEPNYLAEIITGTTAILAAFWAYIQKTAKENRESIKDVAKDNKESIDEFMRSARLD